jgi:polyphosphate kinase 2 (PPK2 family)
MSSISRPAGEFVTFDRSWYNRAGVEPVMGFCTPEQHRQFLDETPSFEKMIVNEGIHFFKFWLDISQEMQLKRFHDRRHSLLKVWKLSPIDIEALGKWDAYSVARDDMLERTDCPHAPWTVVLTNDKPT